MIGALFGLPEIVILIVALLGAAVWALFQYPRWLAARRLVILEQSFHNLAARGKILRGAQVQIHNLIPPPKPIKEEMEALGLHEASPYRYFSLEATITPDPNNSEGDKEGWYPSSLMLTEPGHTNAVDLLHIDGPPFVVEGW